MASNGPQQAVTHLNNHPDTTGICGVGAIGQDCVWAYDNATEKFTVVNTGGQNWTVTMDYVGSFHGFADPRLISDGGNGQGAPLASDGSVKGTITDYVTSPNQPDMSALPGQSPSGTHISDNIRLIFGGDANVVGGPYSFTYHKVAGADYTQIG